MHELREHVDKALDIPISYESFNREIERPHGVVHVTLRCVMRNPLTAAYDPVFWMHHGFIDKVFAQWQIGDTINREKYISFIDSTRTMVLEPFNNPSKNDFHEITHRPNSETWDYQKNLGYEYDTLEVSDKRHQICRQVTLEDEGNKKNWNLVCQNVTVAQGRRTTSTGRLRQYTSEGEVIVPTLEVRTYAAFVVPLLFGGTISYQFCEEADRWNSCTGGTLYAFGAVSFPAKPVKPLPIEDLIIQTDLQLDKLVVSETIPSSTPNEMKWEKITLEGQASDIVSKPPFVVYIIEQKGEGDLKIAHLPKSVKKNEYGDLLEGFIVKEYCESIKVARRIDNGKLQEETWQLGRACN